MTSLNDFITMKGNVFMSIKNPAPIVRIATELRRKGWVWIATPEQARKVREQDYVTVMEESHRMDPKKGMIHGGFYFSIIGTEWKPKGTEPIMSEIPAEVLA